MNWIQFFDVIYKLLTRREQDALRAIRREYEAVVRDLLGEVGAIYNRIGPDGKLSFTDIVAFKQMKELQQRAVAQANRLGRFNRTTIEKLLEESYDLSYSWMGYGIERAIDRTLENSMPGLATMATLNRSNMVDKLVLTAALEKSRAKITIGIQDAIEKGLVNGADFKQMAGDIQRVFEMDYNRALTIAETEVHRIREKGSNDSAKNAARQGINMEKVWVNMGDERVRKTRKADHRILHGQRKQLEEPFQLKGGVTAPHPGASNTPYNDIRCRCLARYEVVGIQTIGVAEGQEALTRDFQAWKDSKAI